MTIHSDHPFAVPDDSTRRFRGRLGGAVTLLTSGEVGLTVSSVMVAGGEPPRLLALVDPDSDLADALQSGVRATCSLLQWRHRDLAEAFAGRMPSPGGPFRMGEFVDAGWGPRPVEVTSYAEVLVESLRTIGWSTEVCATLERVVVGDDHEPLEHRRGRYGVARD